MQGDFSVLYFDPREHERGVNPPRQGVLRNINGVLHQQGRVITDADLTEGELLELAWNGQAGRDIIGSGVCAVPAAAPQSFRVESAHVSGDEVRIKVRPGRAWADGILSRLAGATTDPSAAIERRARYFGPPLTNPLPLPNSIGDNTRDAVVLEVSEEALHGLQYPDQLIEPALGGPDTAERSYINVRFRLLRLAEGEDCTGIIDRLKDDPSSKGRLSVSLAPVTAIAGDCPVVGGGGYLGFEHNLYRIEIADGPPSAPPRFKWSQWNGGLVGRGRFDATVSPPRVIIDAGRTAIVKSGLTEFYLEALQYDELDGTWNVVYGTTATLNIENDLELAAPAAFGALPSTTDPVFFRLWNGLRDIADFINAANPVPLRDGIRLEFDAPGTGNYQPRDYWTFTVRAGEIANPATLIDQAPPTGIVYHRVPLAEIHWAGDTVTGDDIEDCRRVFDPLTDLRGCCIDVKPGEDIHRALEKIFEAGGGCICLLPGKHILTRPIDLSGKSGICIKGFGIATQLTILGKVKSAAFLLKNAHSICFDSFAVFSAGQAPVWACAQTTDLTLTNLFVFGQLQGSHAIISTSGAAGSRWLVEHNIFIAPFGLSGLSVDQSTFRSNYWLGTLGGIDVQNLMEVAIKHNYFLGISDADLKRFLALSSEVDLKKAFSQQNIFQSLLQFLDQQNTVSLSAGYNAIDVSGGFDLTITGNRMAGRSGINCEIIENTKITNNDFLTTIFGLSCGIVRNLMFSENRIGRRVSNTGQVAVTCKVGLRAITDVIDCRVLYNIFDNVEEGIVFESDLDGGKETIRDFAVRNFVGSFTKTFDTKAALKESEELTTRSRAKHILLKSSFFIIGKCERTRIEGNHFRASKLAIEWSGTKDVVDFKVSDNAITGCQQTAIQIEPDDKISFITEPIETSVRLIEKNRFDIFGAALRSTVGGVRFEHNDIRVRKPIKIGIKDFDITKVIGEKLYSNPKLVQANVNRDYSGSRMFLKDASTAAKKNPGTINKEAFVTAVKTEYLDANAPYKGDTRADDLHVMMTLANVGALTLLLDLSEFGFFKANVNQEGFAVNLGGVQNRVNGNTLYSDNPNIESGVIFHLLSGEARENNILVQRIGIMMNAKAGQASQDVRIEGNTLRVTGLQGSGGASEIAYALSIPTLKPGNLTILDNYFEGSVMVGAEPFASLGLITQADIKTFVGNIHYNAIKYDSGVHSYIFHNKAQPMKTKPTTVKENVVIGLIDTVMANIWSSNPHVSRPVVQFADNRVVRGWAALAQSSAGAFWTATTLKKQASTAMVLTVTNNTFDYWARVTAYDLILTGNHSQSAIQYRVGNEEQLVANIPKPKTF